MRDPWSVLGVSRGASQKQIKVAFRLLAKKCHPDLVSPVQRAEAERRFKQIAEAHAQLTHGNWHRTATGATCANNVRTASTRRAWEAGGQHGPGESTRLSNTLLASILATPLIMTGVYLAKRADDAHTLSSLSWRPHGLLHPPHNPYLRDDLQERREHKSSLPIFGWLNGGSAAAQPAEAHGPASAR